MKTLFLLRHAKSSWDDPTKDDFDRPLNGRGKEAAPRIGKFIQREKLHLDLVLSSPAKRAKQTIARVMESGKLTAELRYDERIYDASARTLLAVVSEIDDRIGAALLVG